MTDTTWHDAEESRGCNSPPVRYQWAETEDPRVLAVIEYDDDARIDDLYDGDAINPVIYVEHHYGLKFRWVAGYDGGEAELMQKAYDQWGWDGTARRYLWIFHGIAADNANGGYDRDGNWIVATSTAYRKHVGNEEPASYAEALEDVAAIVTDLSDALDGYVFGAGYATNEARRLPDDEPIDLTDGSWEIEIQCWGFVGEKYARETALNFEDGRPDLPEMLPIEVLA
jgi:hypothetical protein